MGLGIFTGCAHKDEPRNSAPDEKNDEIIIPDNELKFTQEKVVKRDKFLEKDVFSQFLSNAEQGFLVPGLAQFFIPQGISFSEKPGLIFISNESAIPDAPSVISAVDAKSGELVGEFPIYMADGSPFTSHMGGIAAVGDWVYVSAKADEYKNYQIAKISLSELQQQGRHDVKIEELIKVGTSPSFLNYSEGILWVGNFYHPEGKYPLPRSFSGTHSTSDGSENGCYIIGYIPDENGCLKMEGEYPAAKLVISAPNKIQGMCAANGSIYLSQSYGRKNDSSILEYTLDFENAKSENVSICGKDVPCYELDSTNLKCSIAAMPMSEGLCLDSNDDILILFESGAGKYDDGRDRTDTVWKLSLN